MPFRMSQAFVLSAMLAGCGSEAPSEPQAPIPARPAIAGTYFIDARFDSLTSPALGSNGFLGLGYVSVETRVMGGAMRMGATLGKNYFPSWEASGIISFASGLQDVILSPDNTISFSLTARGTQWTFSGTVAGQTARGRHTLSDGVTTLSGDWSMNRGEIDTRGLQPSTTVGLCEGLLADGSWYGYLNGPEAGCYVSCPFCNFYYGTVDLGPLD